MCQSEDSRSPVDDVLSAHGPSLGSRPALLSSDELLHGQREVWIRHGNETYRLIHTRNGKLILQK